MIKMIYEGKTIESNIGYDLSQPYDIKTEIVLKEDADIIEVFMAVYELLRTARYSLEDKERLVRYFEDAIDFSK